MKISITPEKIDGRDVFAWTVTDERGEILFASLSDTKENARNDMAVLLTGRVPRVHHCSPGPNRWRERSRTLPGVAAAMAAQWTAYLSAQ